MTLKKTWKMQLSLCGDCMGKLCTDLARALPENTISKASAIFQHILHPVKVIAWSYFGTETGQVCCWDQHYGCGLVCSMNTDLWIRVVQAFHLSLNMLSQETHRAVKDVIDSCRQPLLVMPLLTWQVSIYSGRSLWLARWVLEHRGVNWLL